MWKEFLVVEAFSLQKVVEMLEKVAVDWSERSDEYGGEAKVCSPVRAHFEALVV